MMSINKRFIITAGSSYLDIDAYACSVALRELLCLQGLNAIAYSNAPCNYSVCDSLITEGELVKSLPFGYEDAEYIVVDVSDPDYIKDSVQLDRVVKVYDHHTGFESYWESRIGENAHIEFIGAAATLIYREWKKAGLVDQMTRSTSLLLIAAILDNTLNLTSPITTDEDREAFYELCQKENINENWCASYFMEVQNNVESDLKNALFNDMKRIHDNPVLPEYIAQLCVWDSSRIFERLSEIHGWIIDKTYNYMINLIDIKQQCSYFVCDRLFNQKEIEKVFGVHFENGIAKSSVSYLRKEIIKKTMNFGG